MRLKLGVGGEVVDIRPATIQDRDSIKKVYSSAFPEGGKEIVSGLALALLSDKTTPPTISLVAETGGVIIGHTAFSAVRVGGAESFLGYILAPLAVSPDYQGRRIGSELVEYGIRKVSAIGVDVVFVYGDPGYYGRFGFSADAACEYTAPYKLQYPSGWQAIVLNEYVFEETPRAIACVSALRDQKFW